MIPLSNDRFLAAVFGDEYDKAHVTCFTDDPSSIPTKRQPTAWKGGYFRDYPMLAQSNQYFTISTFSPDKNGTARRRKALYLQTHCFVLDDVREKLSLEQAQRLPRPSWILETSPGSEQWGYILAVPCTDAAHIDNLNDGLINSELVPQGKDPGQRGITRYVRLPEGVNTKASKLVNGQPFQCRLKEWEPERKCTLEQLAAPFSIDLDAPRRESRVDGAADVQDHPLLAVDDLIHVKAIRSAGRFDITCPWVDEHTGAADNGTAVFTNADGSIGFKCHHGACQERTGRDLLALVEQQEPGFGARLKSWQTTRALADVADVSFMNPPAMVQTAESDGLQQLMDKLRHAEPGSSDQQSLAAGLLRLVDQLPEIAKVEWHKSIRDVVGWNAAEFKSILKDLRGDWYAQRRYSRFDPYRYIYLAPRNEFYDTVSGCSIPPAGLNNKYLSECENASRVICVEMEPELSIADGLAWNPTGPMPPSREKVIFEDEGKRLVNTWRGFALMPMEGDVTVWLEHIAYLIPERAEQEVVLDYLASLVQRVGEKPAFAILHRGEERNGKDSLYEPVSRAIGSAAKEAKISDVLEGWGDYLYQTKFLIITEVDRAQDKRLANAMKTVVAPTNTGKMRLNLKGGQVVTQVDCMGVLMMTNFRNGFAIGSEDQRYFVVDSWVKRREPEYYSRLHNWYRDENGPAKVLNYLLARDISQFNHRALPFVTQGAREMAEASRYDYEQDLEDLILEGRPPFDAGAVTSKELKALCSRHGMKVGNSGLEEAMRRLGWSKVRGQKRIDGKVDQTPTFYAKDVDTSASKSDLYVLYHKLRLGQFTTILKDG